MTTDIDEARDWQGNELRCADCAHAQLAAAGGCALKRACVQDRYARRIDRFFAWNPAVAAAYIDHPYFETRAIAAKYASVFLLPPLLADPDATVRWSAAARLPRRHLLRLREDPDREVRIRVAHRLKGADLIPMMTDPDYYVRQVVVRYITALLLPQMVRDVDAEVRRVVAERIDAEWLMAMAADEDARVRLEVVRRLPAVQLKWMQGDPDWRVRYELAGRLDAAALTALLADADPLVRERCRQRIEAAIAPDIVAGRKPQTGLVTRQDERAQRVGLPLRPAALASATAPCVALPPASMQSSIPSATSAASRASDSARGPRTRVPDVPPMTSPIGDTGAVSAGPCEG